MPQVSGTKMKAKAPASANAHLALIWSIQTLEGKQASICCHLRVTLREALGNSAHLHREVGLPTGCSVCAVVGRRGVSTQTQGVPSIYKPHANRPRATGPKGYCLGLRLCRPRGQRGLYSQHSMGEPWAFPTVGSSEPPCSCSPILSMRKRPRERAKQPRCQSQLTRF